GADESGQRALRGLFQLLVCASRHRDRPQQSRGLGERERALASVALGRQVLVRAGTCNLLGLGTRPSVRSHSYPSWRHPMPTPNSRFRRSLPQALNAPALVVALAAIVGLGACVGDAPANDASHRVYLAGSDDSDAGAESFERAKGLYDARQFAEAGRAYQKAG